MNPLFEWPMQMDGSHDDLPVRRKFEDKPRYGEPYYRWTWMPPFRERVRDVMVRDFTYTQLYCHGGPCKALKVYPPGCMSVCEICGTRFDRED